MNSNSNNDGWKPVRRGGGGWSDSASAAFGGGGRMASRREEEARHAWEDRRAATEKERAAAAAAVKKAKALDTANKEEYPVLGGAGAAPKPKPSMNFRDMARETAARTALEEAEAAATVAQRRVYEVTTRPAAAPHRLYRHGSYDDGPVDHDFPDEEGYYPPDNEEEEDAEPATEEFNSHLAVTRRRGDKTDW